ncbi:MAG: FtsX-like permease family protein [Eubacteriales bacterium]
MYIVKNALKCISRSKGRNVLIGVIVLVIAISACLGLSIRQAAESAKSEIMKTLSVTGTISFNRTALMKGMTGGQMNGVGEAAGKFDRTQFTSLMGESESLTLEEYQKYAAVDCVQSYYYTMTVSLNGSDAFEPVSNTASTSYAATAASTEGGTDFGNFEGFGEIGGMAAGRDRVMGVQSDFSVVGVSGEAAMTSFIDGTASITDGSVFTEGTEDFDCIISEELAVFNSLSVGDSVTLTNPNNEEESYSFRVVGIFADSSTNESSFSMMGSTSTDPANRIYMSYAALQKVVDASAGVAVTQTDETTGIEYDTAVTGTLAFTYVFADTDAYYQFEEDVRTMGLDESYTVSSSDISAFENSLVPLNTLSKMAGYFLIVILLIGAIILIVLNIFNVRERKYEIGVLTAMGMKKGKVALQFLTEIFVVTLAAVVIGVGVGAVSSVPVTNALLENQISSRTSAENQIEQNFGRGEMMPTDGSSGGKTAGKGAVSQTGSFFGGGENNYVTEISSAMNFTVVLQMLGIAVLLTLAAGTVSMLFVMRYEPLKILANRD